MAKLIKLGIYNKNFKYIIFAICCGLFNNALPGMNYYNSFKPLILFNTKTLIEYSNHKHIHQHLIILVFFFYQFIFRKIMKLN